MAINNTWTIPASMQGVGPLTSNVTNIDDAIAVEEVTAATGATGARTATSTASGAPLGNLCTSFVLRKAGGTVVTPLPPVVTPPSAGFPAKAVAVYKMCYNDSPAAPIGNLVSWGFNVINMAFAFNDPPSMVGFGPEGSSAFLAAKATARAVGVKFVASFGGQGNVVNTSNRTAFMNGIASINSSYAGIDGIDWDVEASPIIASDIIWINQQCKAVYGSQFSISFAQNGGNVGSYMSAIVGSNNANVLDSTGQQFYDSAVSLSGAQSRISELIGNGISETRISVGMMNPPGSVPNGYWDNATCKANYQAIRAAHPGITKAYYWEGSRIGAQQWAADMKSVNG